MTLSIAATFLTASSPHRPVQAYQCEKKRRTAAALTKGAQRPERFGERLRGADLQAADNRVLALALAEHLLVHADVRNGLRTSAPRQRQIHAKPLRRFQKDRHWRAVYHWGYAYSKSNDHR
jgi:hypothetical protein